MGTIRDFLAKIFGPKQKLLPEKSLVNTDKAFENKSFLNFLKAQPIETYKEPSLEECVRSYIYNYEKQAGFSNKDLPYKAFSRLLSERKQEEQKNNLINERKFREWIKKSDRYYLSTQGDFDSGIVHFYHISEKNSQGNEITNESLDVEKLYLNCKRENIAKLAYAVLSEMDKIKNCTVQMKFLSEDTLLQNDNVINNNYLRNDKIVIYAKEKDKDKIVYALNQLRSKKQDLFSGNNPMPIMAKYNGFIGHAKQIWNNMIETPLGKSGGSTYNEKVSHIINNCLISAVKEIALQNRLELPKTDDYESKHTLEFIEIYKKMTNEQQEKVVARTGDMIKVSLELSNLESIFTKVKEQERQQ